jgi:RNA polymerase sigma-70 factor (ECF subfamily)
LLKRIQGGDRAACEEFVRMHYKPVYGLLFNLSRNTALAEDLTQETFAAAWRHIGEFDGRRPLGAWLYRIGYNKFLDWQRSHTRRNSAEGSVHLARTAPHPTDNPVDRLLGSERARQLYDAIHRLDSAGRAVVVMHYLQGLSYREMAEVLGEPAGTVKWRVSETLARLRETLQAEATDD